MRRHFIMRLICFLLLGCRLPAQGKIPISQLIREMSRLLSWRWFWEGQTGPKSYTPGKVVEMGIVESPNEVAAFVSEIGVAAFFQLQGDEIARTSIHSIPDASNASAINRYIATLVVTPGFAFKQGKAPTSSDVPVRRDNLNEEEKRQFFKQHSTSFTLPNLSPPDYITSHRAPPDLAHFQSTVLSRAEGFYSTNCGKGQIVIPYFDLTDPTVYVYADLGTCDKGIIGFIRDEKGQWTSGQFSPARPPNQWSITIQRIRENRAVTIPLPDKQN